MCTVATLGFLERENAALLNASIRPYARTTIAAFQRAVARRLHPGCPVFLTQNDGTILSAARAAHLPIRTFSSGPTNSMCGAAFLVRGMRAGAEDEGRKGPMLVVDIGGTTTDVGMLLPSGLPRQAAAITTIAGIRVNFSCPDVQRCEHPFPSDPFCATHSLSCQHRARRWLDRTHDFDGDNDDRARLGRASHS